MHHDPLSAYVEANYAKLRRHQFAQRLWQRDGTLFCRNPSDQLAARAARNRLGWLFVPPAMRAQVEGLAVLARVAERHRFDRVIVIGCRGIVAWADTLGQHMRGRRGLQVRGWASDRWQAFAAEGKALFVVAAQGQGGEEWRADFDQAWQAYPHADRFVAVAPAGSELHALATAREFREVFANPPDIDSTLAVHSLAGLVPAVLAGVVLHEALDATEEMLDQCREPEPALHPGLALGAWLAAAVQAGRRHLTVSASADLAGSAEWIAAAVAEAERLAGVEFPVRPRALGPAPDAETAANGVAIGLATFARPDDPWLDAARDAGMADTSFVLPRPADLWAECVRWQFALAALQFLLSGEPDRPATGGRPA